MKETLELSLKPGGTLHWINVTKLELSFPESPSGKVWVRLATREILLGTKGRSEAAAIFPFRR